MTRWGIKTFDHDLQRYVLMQTFTDKTEAKITASRWQKLFEKQFIVEEV